MKQIYIPITGTLNLCSLSPKLSDMNQVCL